MSNIVIPLVVATGVAIPIWHVASRQNRHSVPIEDIHFYASVATFVALALALLALFWLGLGGTSFKDIAGAHLPRYKSRDTVYFIYFTGSLSITYWAIYAIRLMQSSRSA